MFNIIRRDPFREMLSIRNTMDRLFQDAFADWDLDPTTTREMPLDVVENDNDFVVKASLPGIDPDDIEITYSGNSLTIKGEIKSESESEKGHYHLRERRYGSFMRTLNLPSLVESDRIEAGYESGVLKLRLPKAEETKPKRIAIKGSSAKMIEGKASDINQRN